ncbi:MAG: chromate resistance protein, partial [Actinobacteria bacterium]|nr:chromate resistance protein [Actinomycetota bacterium]
MDAVVGVADAEGTRWLLLIYHLPREPSCHRVAVWRKLKALGALYLQDGAAALPEDAVTREQLEWLQLRVREAGGRATLWEGQPSTLAEGRDLAETFRSSREEAYRAIIAK